MTDLVGYKFRIYPTVEQTKFIDDSMRAYRWVYNWTLCRLKRAYVKSQQENYEQSTAERLKLIKYQKDNTKSKKPTGKIYPELSEYTLCNELVKLKNKLKICNHPENWDWLFGASNSTLKTAIKIACRAHSKFLKGKGKVGYPKFKSRLDTKQSFGTEASKSKFRCTGQGIWLGKIYDISAKIDLSMFDNPRNPRIKFDGVNYWVTFSHETNKSFEPMVGEPIGVDLGLKTLATCSNGMEFNTVNVSKHLNKKLKLQRKTSRQQRKGNKKNKSNRYKKTLKALNKVNQRIANIRLNNIYQMIATIIKCNPRAVVIEDLTVDNMMKNHKLAKSIGNVSWSTIRRILEYKSVWNNFELIVAESTYPSTQLCSACGTRKTKDEKLKLSDRTYICDKCGLVIDRDLNASLNLKALAS